MNTCLEEINFPYVEQKRKRKTDKFSGITKLLMNIDQLIFCKIIHIKTRKVAQGYLFKYTHPFISNRSKRLFPSYYKMNNS